MTRGGRETTKRAPMPVKLSCPKCAHDVPLDEPLPLPGDTVMCASCGAGLAVSYPPGILARLRARGKRFAGEGVAPGPQSSVPIPRGSGWSPPGFKVPAPISERPAPAADPEPALADHGDPTATVRASAPALKSPRKPGRRLLLPGCAGGMAMSGMVTAGVALGLALGLGGYLWWVSQDMPTVEALRAYEPPTVTVVLDRNGKLLGEIFDQRRYVLPLDQIPQHVQDAFLAAEDANFHGHGGIDYIGIVRAMGRNVLAGRMAQGASTITQQVARNFLLTRDKKITRKVKEVLLSWRIEDVYDKDHILYLYLNEIFLGSHAYGVEAASRTYFGKSVRDITVGEAALLAGLPQRPSDYSPHRNWDKARARQEYVLGQMEDKGFLSHEKAEAARAESIQVVPKESAFLEVSPHFTEHVRRQLVETYGEEAVLRGGLQVKSTCDVDLQELAQASVSRHVAEVDQRLGFRREGIETLPDDDKAIAAWRTNSEQELRESWALEQDPAGRVPLPEQSVLEEVAIVQGVLLEVQPKWARVGIGNHEAVLPIGWADWAYDPDPDRSWRHREATNLTDRVDTDADGKDDAALLQKGDVVRVRIRTLDSTETAHQRVMAGTPGADRKMPGVQLWQEPEIEGAMLTMDLATGGVIAMVGGVDFRESQLNRAVQSRRQVGSTFKPIVYAAAINSRKVTAATLVADAPLAFATNDDFVWKPQNYSGDYLGNITMRHALAASKNTCTVRILETIDPGMNNDLVYSFARKLGLGGPPTHALPDGFVPTPQTDLLCPWVREKYDSTICMDRYPPKDEQLTNTAHRAKIGPSDVYNCRACDFSMGLGSASLSVEEMVRAYSVFPTGGRLVQPYTIEEVRDRHGAVLESHAVSEFPQVVDPGVASITTWLLQSVVQGGTAAEAYAKLGLIGMGGKTGTTNEEKDAWFVGFTNDVITAVWVGYDQPKSLGLSSTGGRTALPIWLDVMKVAAPKSKDRPFPIRGDVEWILVDEATGRRVSSGGSAYPFLGGTAPESTGLDAGQMSIEDISTEL